MTRVIPHGATGAIIVADEVPPLTDWQRDALIALMSGPISEACRARIEAVLEADEAAWCDR